IARGLGLGLSIVERLARVLDCTIDLQSETGRGSAFMGTLAGSEGTPVGVPAREETRLDPGQLAVITALCIDNEPSVLDGMETLLRGWGCDVIKAPDLGRAIEYISTGPLTPNGLLIDYHLDQGNGIEAIVQLRRRYGDMQAILITADSSPAVRHEARAQGVQVLHKPIRPAALRGLLAQWRMMLATAAAEY